MSNRVGPTPERVIDGVIVVAQSGGPTPAVNASLAGAIRRARQARRPVLGARFGCEGLLAGDYLDLSGLSARSLTALARTPAAALGSSRYRPNDAELDRVLADFRERNVRWLVMIGGNDSAEIMHRLHVRAAAVGQALGVVGVPKTVDNDLPGMDHTPGYGSAARMVALAVRGTALDTAAMRRSDPVKIVEVAGRNAGWLVAASALARDRSGDAPHLLYLPERPRSLDQMAAEVQVVLSRDGYAVVVICENQCDAAGAPLAGGNATRVDAYGHEYYESPGQALAEVLQAKLGVVARHEKPGSILRSLGAVASAVDLREAEAVGQAAVELALSGHSDVMMAIERVAGPEYQCRLVPISLVTVAGRERVVPDAFIADSGCDITPAFLDYARPLIGAPLPALLRLA